MNKELSVSIVTPIHNEEDSALNVLRQLEMLASKHFRRHEIVIIDDASTDNSLHLVRNYCKKHPHIRLSTHATNQGIAKTYRELYKKAKYDIIVLFSLGGEWDPHDTVSLVNQLTTTKADMVIGVRKNKSYTLPRKIVSFLYNRLTYMVFQTPTYDAGSIKAMTRRVIKLPIISKGVFDEAERIIRASKRGYRITTIPVSHKQTRKQISSWPNYYHISQAVIDMIRCYSTL